MLFRRQLILHFLGNEEMRAKCEGRTDLTFLDVGFGIGFERSSTHEVKIGRLFFDPVGQCSKSSIELNVTSSEMFQCLTKKIENVISHWVNRTDIKTSRDQCFDFHPVDIDPFDLLEIIQIGEIEMRLLLKRFIEIVHRSLLIDHLSSQILSTKTE